ncbi:MAG: hypothetical protein ACUVV6_08115 [Thermoplasmatota archaeon]
MDEGEAKRRKNRRRAALLILLLALAPPLLYLTVIPRTELILRVFYNEGVLNQINVDPELRNAGTLEVGGVELELAVLSSRDEEMAAAGYNVSSVPPLGGLSRLRALTFRGDQYEGYTIVIDLRFRSGGRVFTAHWSHTTAEPWMNQEWRDIVQSLGS